MMRVMFRFGLFAFRIVCGALTVGGRNYTWLVINLRLLTVSTHHAVLDPSLE